MTGDELLNIASAPRRVEQYTLADGRTGYVTGASVEDYGDAGEMIRELGLPGITPALIAICACDADGNRSYDKPKRAAQKLASLPQVPAGTIMLAIERASDLKPGEADDLGNGSPRPTGGGNTASPDTPGETPSETPTASWEG